ncbi:hypothetical protein P168DRAFT_320184 [Aspergillus campestris IBT 28561]|uniref:HMG box domain-containing protein n=1 Tax=Aspergillus campestris (strain IBT 28561) TaxID=1392248 RepID=A0A2I1CYB9_ASPC2|nr:uncharacterized protein P168DRAFT_320184 [Aspergillus campestris IBT 28561]PKY02629.1 hypothetical protein P168DRAFT_320184 [Aspergillus campestris IBT 28561]
MSYDRVLPKPPAFHYDSQVTLSRPTSNLLEHKIMNDDLTKMSVMDHRRDTPAVGASCRYVADALPQVHLSSLNRAKIALNKIASTAPIDPQRSTEPGLAPQLALRERSSVSERSSSASPTKRESETNCPNLHRTASCHLLTLIPTAFILYRQHYQAAVVASNPGLANPEVSKIIGIQWRSLPQDTKDEWKKLAEAEKARHQQQYPEYRYQPRRYGRDGSSRGTSSGISHNPNGSSVCSRCGGRVMNPPVSPDAIFTPNGSTSSSASSATPEAATVRNYHCRTTDAERVPHPIKVETAKVETDGGHHASRQRQWEENGARSPDSKRRRFNPQPTFKSNSHHVPPNYRGPHHTFQMWQPPRPLRSAHSGPPHDPSLTLPPLQTTATTPSAMTPVTPFPKEGSSVEATVMTIPFLNKIKVISKIAPPLTPSFREGAAQRRGAVIAVEGQDSKLVNAMVEHLNHVLQKEGKYQPRVFPGPKVPTGEKYAEPNQAGHGHCPLCRTRAIRNEVGGRGICNARDVPKTIIPKTADMHIRSPSQSSDNGSVSAGSSSGASTCFVPVALVPQYQLTTADFFACSVPLNDSYAVLDHWQWMASLWRGCVGADITVYIRDCEREELDRYGGNPVEVRLQDARTVVLRRAAGSTRDLDEKALKRVGFEIEFFLSQ